MIIREVEKPKFKDLISFSKFKSTVGNILEDIKVVGSGKGAIAIILRYLIEKKIISNKLDEILVPDWIGYWVYNQIQPFAFPVKRFSDKTKAIIIYHQYGWPQDMDKILRFAKEKNLIVIEDCAHALNSYYKGKQVGTFGDFAIYSYSKWFFCFALGGVKSKFADFSDFADKLVSQAPRGLSFKKDFIKLLSELSAFSKNRYFKKQAGILLNMSYAIYGDALKPGRLAKKLLFSKIENEVNERKNRYQYFYNQTEELGIVSHLEKEGIAPYVIPISCPSPKSQELVKALREMGIMTGLYNFDVNKNMLSPNFVPCIWIPCHRGISDKVFSDIIDIVKKNVKK